MKYRQTDRKNQLIKGGVISIILISTPFLFYMYKYAPADQTSWDTFLGTFEAGAFSNVQNYMHALFTKITFVILTGLWFLTSNKWWRYAILVPFTMFLFQLSGVISYKVMYMDEYDFWDALPFILPIIFFLAFISHRLSKRKPSSTLDEEADEEIKKMFSDEI
ncbi:hypothetical protein [uncultured Planktosalinus sp.]|uniref:hypothetical protein n=1 Tax=uncultured Planktosalinus sp. TaxID=1810935 RepID=UPI0030DDDA74